MPDRRTPPTLAVVLSALALLLVACGDGEPTGEGETETTQEEGATVVMENIAFQPSEITVEPGETVTFVHRDGSVSHTITADNGEFTSGQMTGGDTFTVTLDETGSVSYHCENHPDRMTAVIHVGSEAPGQSSDTTTTTVDSGLGY